MTRDAGPDRAEAHFHLFDTAIGACGLAWTDAGIISVQLPEASEAATEARLGRTCAAAWTDALPRDIAACGEGMQRYFSGEAVDFSDVTLDTRRINAFRASVYDALRKVMWGETTSYGALARDIGDPGAARAIGAVMGKNPWPLVVPCHRVLAASGKIGGFSAFGGRATKRLMLQLEKCDADGAAPMLPGLFD
ncbi:methylated-DNA--[protein]-cysteine S-methyltransferase [Hyphomonas johnsonii]|nr:methylated-DNA--[protein]-cysteine S-methyltransferase [Hyphomonas johnsonii]